MHGKVLIQTDDREGWGNWVNTALLALLLLVFGQRGAPYDATSLETVWRLSFFLGLVPVAGMLIWRLFRLEESRMWQEKRRKLKREVRALSCGIPRLRSLLLTPVSSADIDHLLMPRSPNRWLPSRCTGQDTNSASHRTHYKSS